MGCPPLFPPVGRPPPQAPDPGSPPKYGISEPLCFAFWGPPCVPLCMFQAPVFFDPPDPARGRIGLGWLGVGPPIRKATSGPFVSKSVLSLRMRYR